MDQAIDIAAQLPRRAAFPVAREQFVRQLRVAQQQLAVLMDQQDARQETILRVQLLLLAQRLPKRPEQLDEFAVVGGQFFDVPALAHLHAQGLGGQHVLSGGFEQDGFFLYAEVDQGRVDIAAVSTRAGQHHR
ncbi:hypothetical protein D3C80_1209130 [compost metagenome]